MLETNIRIVYPGSKFYMRVRYATVKGTDLSADLLERACGRLRYQYGLAAMPQPNRSGSLLVATVYPVPTISLKDEEWELQIVDAGQEIWKLTLVDPAGKDLLPVLLERTLMAQLARKTAFWTLDSPRIWYEPKPFRIESGIAVYRRYLIAGLPLDDEGIGVAVNVSTAFFTTETLAYFFDPNVPQIERKHREKLFNQLTARQQGQKGTLLYDNSEARVKCYFESAPAGITCATTGTVRVKGKSYASLHDYYQATYPNLKVERDAQAVRVSFNNISKPQWVAAERVRVRVMNDSLPVPLSAIDKIDPEPRRELIQKFWTQLGSFPFGPGLPGVTDGFWRPKEDRIYQFAIPELTFGQERALPAPSESSAQAYRDSYSKRMEYLEEMGCYYVPPDVPRTLYFAYPNSLDRKICDQLARDLTGAVHSWTSWAGCAIQAAQPVGYDSVSEAVDKLRNITRDGVVIFILNDEPAAYHEVVFQLERWRVKRITESKLSEHYRYLKKGRWSNKKKIFDLKLGKRRWREFVNFNAVEVLQLLDVIPFRFNQAGVYEAQLFIDVGHDRRHANLTLLIARDRNKKPDFCIVSDVQVKPDHQHEAINPTILADHIVRLFEKVIRRNSDPIESLLILRDGKFWSEEFKGVDDGLTRLVNTGKIRREARVDLVDFRKDSLKAVRFWEVNDETGAIENPLEGRAVQLNSRMIVVTSTGSATLHQGTAIPFVVVGNGRCSNPIDAAQAAFVGAQLNWSSPKVAQRLPLYVKRADEDLKARADQEIKRFK